MQCNDVCVMQSNAVYGVQCNGVCVMQSNAVCAIQPNIVCVALAWSWSLHAANRRVTQTKEGAGSHAGTICLNTQTEYTD